MKTLVAGLLGSLLVPGALGHSAFGILLVNGTQTPEWKYVLDVASAYHVNAESMLPNSQFYKLAPITSPLDPNITCGRNAFVSAPKTSTADILAGSEVGFRVSVDGHGNLDQIITETHINPSGGPWKPYAWHGGPTMVYLSRALNDDLSSYRGEGDWFKIAYKGPVNNTHWNVGREHEFSFTVPRTTPPGKYLMRIEHIMPTSEHPPYQQFYVNCALVNVIGPGGGTPVGFARFPGTYKPNDPGLQVPRNQVVDYDVAPSELRLLEYKPPGPPVWQG
ncbi:cellulose-growth-specific protein [Naviculisporaceae sp. PSN 640]